MKTDRALPSPRRGYAIIGTTGDLHFPQTERLAIEAVAASMGYSRDKIIEVMITPIERTDELQRHD
jgi:hypothetical protein